MNNMEFQYTELKTYYNDDNTIAHYVMSMRLCETLDCVVTFVWNSVKEVFNMRITFYHLPSYVVTVYYPVEVKTIAKGINLLSRVTHYYK